MTTDGVRVTGLFVYPVKSCAGTAVAEAAVGRRGFAGDREFMVTDVNGLFVTQRELPRMALIAPALADGALTLRAAGMPDLLLEPRTEGALRRAVVWGSTCDAIDQGDEAARWLSEFLGAPLRLARMAEGFSRKVDPDYAVSPGDETGFADGYPFLLLSEGSLADLNGRLPEAVEMRRFRPNIVVAGCAPYAEDGWRRVRIGSVELAVVKPCARCIITTTDQSTAERGREPLATLAAYRNIPGKGVMFGQNLIHAGPGRIAVGDAVEVVSE
jgi:hypothetical protein